MERSLHVYSRKRDFPYTNTQYNPQDLNIVFKTLQNPELVPTSINTRNKARKCEIIHNHLLHVWDFHVRYFSVQPTFLGGFLFCDFWTIFMMMTSYLQIPEEFPLPLPPALLQQHHLPAYKYSWLRHVKITIMILFLLYIPYLKWNTYHKSTVLN